MKKLFVGSLSWDTTDRGLHDAFGQFGEIVEAKVITDRETGRSRGFGFVTFAKDEDADRATAEMNGKELDGRRIVVNVAAERGTRPAGGGGPRGPGGPRGFSPRGGGFGDRGGFSSGPPGGDFGGRGGKGGDRGRGGGRRERGDRRAERNDWD